MIAPRNTISVPARVATYKFANADVREKCGSTWMTLAPRSLALTTLGNATGWASAMLLPIIKIQSLLTRSCGNVVAPPRPNDVPRPGTVELCHIRDWFAIGTDRTPPLK